MALDKTKSGQPTVPLRVLPVRPIPQQRQNSRNVTANLPPPDTDKSRPHQSSGQVPANTSAFEALLQIESEARAAESVSDLCHLIANETRRLTRARQIFVAEKTVAGPMKIVAVSNLGTVDRQSELAAELERAIGMLDRAAATEKQPFAVTGAGAGTRDDLPHSYPFTEMLWLPFKRRSGEVFAGMLLTREQTWSNDDTIVSTRLASAYAHAWRELTSVPRYASNPRRMKRLGPLTLLAGAAALFIPVSMTALAPVEVVAASPFVVAAPLDGVIDDVLVEPSSAVKKDQVLLRFSDTVLRNRAGTADREVIVAEAQLKKVSQSAFDDPRGRHELGVADAELALKKAERDFAKELLAKTVMLAPRDGIAVYPDRKTLIGKPVSAGERIMEIAEPAEVELRVDLAVEDAMALEKDSRVKVFLDVEPLSARSARVVRSEFRAKPGDNGTMTFKTTAKFDAGRREPPRLGLRGTGQIYGQSVPLVVYLLRRPISALRQIFGL